MSIAYAGPVIDPHHHLWDLSLGRHSWLAAKPAGTEEMVFGSIAAIQRDYGVAEYLADAAGQNVVATVHIEAGWSDDFPLAETAWLDGLDKADGIASRYVARVPLDSPDAARLLEEEAGNPRTVGIRDILSWHPETAKSFARSDTLMSDTRWRDGLALASRLGLSFDLMIYPWQMDEAARLIADFPETRFILNHGGSPADSSDEGMALWREGLKALGRFDNLSLKISDLVAYDNDWTLESLTPVIRHCIDCFGPERSMFGSDFPVAGLHATFDQVYKTFRAAVAGFSLDEQRALFFSTANRVYRLGLAEPLTGE